ncbi:uncharacterized protein PAC_10743 [Phialocephala subalpina]|uniref:Zn(2)-C6 fungal-type domain-containing protein n=1 Tax=Phialocephala subalpina TaxID=576137 RepID=A0A1L7X763_9HELO|nr:uncharacterized protein PAC_10743 [Phialocephala subalpina]
MPNTMSTEQECLQRPDRKEKKRRSKNGCITCRTVAKMKCDEEKPTCGRCSRLKLTCCWKAGPSLRERRRGVGTWRSREHWQPSPIFPKGIQDSNDSAAESHSTLEDVENETASPLSCHVNDWLDAQTDDLNLVPLSDAESLRWPVADRQSNIHLESSVNSMIRMYTADRLLQTNYQVATAPPVLRELPGFRTSLPNALMLNDLEHKALQHYSTSFSASFTKKHPKWSTLSMLLRIGSSKAMVMHLLLAVSLNDLALRRHDEDLRAAARTHYREGASQLIEQMTSGTEPDHIGILATFWFFYLYKMKWMHVDVEYMNQLSRTVTGHIEKHKLDALCYNTYSTAAGLYISERSSQSITPRDSSVVALMITCLYYQDIKYGFYYCGGKLAEYLNSDKSKLGTIYDLGRSALALNWGTEYPINEVADDNENYLMLKMNSELNILVEDINKKYTPVFRLAATTTKPRTRTLVNADLSIAYFHAVRIYLFRCTPGKPSAPCPTDIQQSLRTILSIAHKTFASEDDALFHRIEWPLFIAGVETNDSIHREWIQGKLGESSIGTALDQVLQVQQMIGRRVGVEYMRDAFCRGLGMA